MAVKVCVLAHLYGYSGVCWLTFMDVAHIYGCPGVCAGSPSWL